MKFKECVNVKVREAAFAHLINRKCTRNSEKAKGKNLEHSEHDMSEYLTPIDKELSVYESKC